MKNEIKNSLQIIFAEIDKMKDLAYSKIKDKRLENCSEIWEAIEDTGLYKYLRQFELYGRQYDVNKIAKGIRDYIDYSIVSIVERERWQ